MASIHDLPDEVLEVIFDQLSSAHEKYEWLHTWEPSMTLVCRRWARVFQRRIYTTLVFHGERETKRAFRPSDVIPTLRRRPDLCRQVQHVYLGKAPDEHDQDEFDQLFDLVMPILRLDAVDWSEQRMPLLTRLTQTNCLQHLGTGWITVCRILHMIGQSDLQSLRLHHIIWQSSRYDRYHAVPWDDKNERRAKPKAVIPEIRERSGKLKHLRLEYCSITPRHLKLFLRWPAALHSFALLNTTNIRRYYLEDLRPLFEIHHTTLREISLDRLAHFRGDDCLFMPFPFHPPDPPTRAFLRLYPKLATHSFPLNFSHFPNLRRLSLNAHDRLFGQMAEHLGAALAAPNLTHLVLTFDHNEDDGSLDAGCTLPIFCNLFPAWLLVVISTLQDQQLKAAAKLRLSSQSSTALMPTTTETATPSPPVSESRPKFQSVHLKYTISSLSASAFVSPFCSPGLQPVSKVGVTDGDDMDWIGHDELSADVDTDRGGEANDDSNNNNNENTTFSDPDPDPEPEPEPQQQQPRRRRLFCGLDCACYHDPQEFLETARSMFLKKRNVRLSWLE